MRQRNKALTYPITCNYSINLFTELYIYVSFSFKTFVSDPFVFDVKKVRGTLLKNLYKD